MTEILSIWRHPHDLVRLPRKLSFSTMATLPHSHLHNERDRNLPSLYARELVGFITVNFPKICPVKSNFFDIYFYSVSDQLISKETSNLELVPFIFNPVAICSSEEICSMNASYW